MVNLKMASISIICFPIWQALGSLAKLSQADHHAFLWLVKLPGARQRGNHMVVTYIFCSVPYSQKWMKSINFFVFLCSFCEVSPPLKQIHLAF